ncbi:hypothetical protein ACFL2R_00045 [Patescibacteria group bacterium]
MKKHCPLFVDFTRECISKIETFPTEISFEMMNFCQTEKHTDCPFYKMLKTDESVCKNVKKCSAFKKFQRKNFDEFVKISNEFCTGDYKNCLRYQKKEKGEPVPENLHPEGGLIREEEKEQ